MLKTELKTSQFEKMIDRVRFRMRTQDIANEFIFLLSVFLFGWSIFFFFGRDTFFFESIEFLVLVVCAAVMITAHVLAVTWRRTSKRDAAAIIDEQNGLQDEMVSALWFSEADRSKASEMENQFVDAHLHGALSRSGRIQLSDVAPIQLPRNTPMLVTALIFSIGLMSIAPQMVVADISEVDERVANPSVVQADSAGVAEAPVPAELGEIDKALAALEGESLSFPEKQKLVKETQELIDQINMETMLTREGLSKLSKILMKQEGFEAVGEALDQGNIKVAIELLREKQQELAAVEVDDGNPIGMDQQTGVVERNTDVSSAEVGEAARNLLNEANRPDPQNVTRLIESLEQAQQNMENQQAASQAGARMEDMGERIGAVQTAAADLGGRPSTSDQSDVPTGTPSPDVGNNDMSGNSMFRKGSVTPNEKEDSDDGSSTGAPDGHVAALALEGRMTQRLDAILRLEKTEVESDSEAGEDSAWEFQESKYGAALTETANGVESTDYRESEVVDGEFVSVEQRKSVQQYFIEIHEGKN